MLETQRLILTVGQISDAPDMLELNSDPDVVRYVGDGPLTGIAEAEKVVRERLIPQWEKFRMGRFTVRLKENGDYAGWCGLRFFPEYDEVDLGYRFHKRHWGKGFGTESSEVVLKYGFETLGLKKIMAKAMPENVGSIKIMQKLGMTFTGYRTEPGDPHPHVIYVMTAEDYRRRP